MRHDRKRHAELADLARFNLRRAAAKTIVI
jgi:hypothetical protein